MPRPDLQLLGIAYRRIPVLSIGRDVYLDTRLILQKLEVLYPPSAAHPPLSAKTGEHAAIERLLSRYTTDGGLFSKQINREPAPFLSLPRGGICFLYHFNFFLDFFSLCKDCLARKSKREKKKKKGQWLMLDALTDFVAQQRAVRA